MRAPSQPHPQGLEATSAVPASSFHRKKPQISAHLVMTARVFRVRHLPNGLDSFDDVEDLLSRSLADSPAASPAEIRVFSLATTLQDESPPSKIATVMFS